MNPPTLAALLESSEAPVRLAAATALARCGSEWSVAPVLQALCRQPDRFFRVGQFRLPAADPPRRRDCPSRLDPSGERLRSSLNRRAAVSRAAFGVSQPAQRD